MFIRINDIVVEFSTKNQIVAIFNINNGNKTYDNITINGILYHLYDYFSVNKTFNDLSDLKIDYINEKTISESMSTLKIQNKDLNQSKDLNQNKKIYIPSWSKLTDDIEIYKEIFVNCKSEEDYILAEYVYAYRFNNKKYIKYLNKSMSTYSPLLKHYVKQLKYNTSDYMFDFYEEHVGQM
jgi:hypothetical protein